MSPHAKRRVKSLRFWRWKSPAPGRVLYSVRSGVREYRRRGPSMEPPWLRFLNHANNLVCVNTSHKAVRFYVRYYLRSKAALSSGLWLNMEELNHLEDVVERLRKGEFILPQKGRFRPYVEAQDLHSWDNRPNSGCGEEPQSASPMEGRKLENLFPRRLGNRAKPAVVHKLQSLLNKVNQEVSWNHRIPGWHQSNHWYPHWILRSSASKFKKFRHRVLSFLARLHYIAYYVVKVDIGLPYQGNTASLIRRSKSDLSSHLLQQASLSPNWRCAASKLYLRLKVLLFP